MRTINEAVILIKESDPDSAITYHSIRRLCDQNVFTVVKIGKKYLINFDELLNYLNIGE